LSGITIDEINVTVRTAVKSFEEGNAILSRGKVWRRLERFLREKEVRIEKRVKKKGAKSYKTIPINKTQIKGRNYP
jgi:hypothetical protein